MTKAIKKLEESGLTKADADLLDIQPLDSAQTSKLHSIMKPLASLKINYRGPDGKKLSDRPGGQPYYRIRYLEEPKAIGFDAMSDKKALRYVQEPDTLPVVYYPQNYKKWKALCKDVSQPLIITEGELKAAKSCKAGFPAIGLGGVYAWSSKKRGCVLVKSLDFVEWDKRTVYLVFDSDYKTNPNVCYALKLFADELEQLGCYPYMVDLPELPGLDKVGLDDFLVHSGSATNKFQDLLDHAEPLGLAQPLWEMNRKYIYVQSPGMIVSTENMAVKISPSAFKEHAESKATYLEGVLKADGTITYNKVSAASSWIKWQRRLDVRALTYKPGEKQFLGEDLNTWPGWGLTPKRGSVKLFLELVDHIFTGAEEEAKKWFLQWCAYPLQYPGTKLFSSVVVHGIRQGTGKSLIGYTVGSIYGKNFTEISQRDIQGSFNEWAESKQFIMGDDVTGSDKRADADELKKMITQKEIRLNAKYMPSYTMPDCINYYFTTNHPNAFFLEDDDRRFFIHEVMVGSLPDKFYEDYEQWWLKENGASAVFKYLLSLDLKGFKPNAAAFRTHAKDRQISIGKSDLSMWVHQLRETPDHVLKVGNSVVENEIMTSKELLIFYDPEQKTRVTQNGMTREMKSAGFVQVANGTPLKIADGSQARYFAVRNPSFWTKRNAKQIIVYLNNRILKEQQLLTKKY